MSHNDLPTALQTSTEPRTSLGPPNVGRTIFGVRLTRVAVVAGSLAVLAGCGTANATGIAAVITTTTAPATVAPAQLVAEPVTTTSTTVPPTTAAEVTTTTAATTTTTTTSTVPPTTVAAYETPAPAAPTPTFPSDNDKVEDAPLIGNIRIPAIDVDMSLYDGVTLPTLDLGPGHWPGTAWPGQVGNVVIGGHRTSHHAVFRRVDELQPGDQILIDDAYGTHIYNVSRVQIVEPTDVWIVNPTETATVTLFACHPPGSTRQRIVVFGDLVS